MGMIPQYDKCCQHTCEWAQRRGRQGDLRIGIRARTDGRPLRLYLISLVFLKTGFPSFSSPMSNRSEYSSLFLWSTWKSAQRSAFTRFFAYI